MSARLDIRTQLQVSQRASISRQSVNSKTMNSSHAMHKRPERLSCCKSSQLVQSDTDRFPVSPSLGNSPCTTGCTTETWPCGQRPPPGQESEPTKMQAWSSPATASLVQCLAGPRLRHHGSNMLHVRLVQPRQCVCLVPVLSSCPGKSL